MRKIVFKIAKLLNISNKRNDDKYEQFKNYISKDDFDYLIKYL